MRCQEPRGPFVAGLGKPRVFIAQPVHNLLFPQCKNNQAQMMRTAMERYDMQFGELLGESLICRARNILLHQFLRTSADYLFFLDSDILFFPKEENDCLIANLLAHGKDIVGGVYPIKIPPHKPAFRTLDWQELPLKRASLIHAVHDFTFADAATWQDAIAWLTETASTFKPVFAKEWGKGVEQQADEGKQPSSSSGA